MNLIFLDVDGVLNSAAYFKQNKKKYCPEISDYHLQMLAKIYHTCNAKIVLSSSWRELDDPNDAYYYKHYQYLLDELARYDMEIISKTPLISIPLYRPAEITEWLNKNKNKFEDLKYVILDDDYTKEDYDPYGLGYAVVHTEFSGESAEDCGLQQKHVDQAIKILQS